MNTATCSTNTESPGIIVAGPHPARANDAVETLPDAADRTLDSVQHGVNNLREQIPEQVARAADGLRCLARSGMERALNACHAAKGRIDNAGERTVSYVRQEPMKSVLIAAASGAALVGVLSLWARSRVARKA
ncbi:MAG: hypothetical protein QM739_14325 [Propionivibrio sp.]